MSACSTSHRFRAVVNSQYSRDAHPALRERAQLAMDAWRILLQRIVDKGIMRGNCSTVDADTVLITQPLKGQ